MLEHFNTLSLEEKWIVIKNLEAITNELRLAFDAEISRIKKAKGI